MNDETCVIHERKKRTFPLDTTCICIHLHRTQTHPCIHSNSYGCIRFDADNIANSIPHTCTDHVFLLRIYLIYICIYIQYVFEAAIIIIYNCCLTV